MSTQAAAQTASLPPSELQLDGKSPAVVEFGLEQGEFLQVEVRALGVDITLSLLTPDNTVLWESDDRPTTEGVERLWFVAHDSLVYRLRVDSRWNEPGSARIERLYRRPATETDRRRSQAEFELRQTNRDRRKPDADLEAIVDRFRTARQAFDELGVADRAAYTATREGIVLAKLGRIDEAESLLRATIEAAQRRGDAASEATALNSLAVRAFGQGDLRRALAFHEEAERLALAVDDPLIGTRIQLNLGLDLSYIGEHRRAAQHYQRGGELARDLGWLDGEATAWFNASLAHRGLRDYGAYFEDLRRADPLLSRLGQAVDQGRLRMNEGVAYLDLGQFERAEERFNSALEVLPEEELVERARAILNLGSVAKELGELATARIRVESALTQVSALDVPKLQGSGLGVLAAIDLAQNRTEEAIAHARESAEIARSSGVERILPDALVILGEALQRHGETDTAAKVFAEALSLGQQQEDLKVGVSARLGMARLYRDIGDLRAALAEAEAGIEAVEGLRSLVPTLELRASLLARYRSLFDLAIELRLLLDRQLPGAGHAETAFTLAERSRARSLLDSLPMLAWRTDEASERLRDLGSALLAARDHHANSADLAEVERTEAARDLDLALAAYETTRADWLTENSHARARLERRPATLAAVQTAMADDELLLEYHAGEERTLLFAVSRDRFEVLQVGTTAGLASDVELVLDKMLHPSLRGAVRFRDASWHLSQHVLPLGQLGSIEGLRLIIAPDGPLVGLPFGVLVTSLQGSRFDDLDYLGRNHDITYLPSAAVGLELRSRAKRRPNQGVKLVVFGDPKLAISTGSDDPRGNETLDLPPLAGAREEARHLGELMGPSQVWLGDEASESRVRELSAAPPHYLHLATHALVDERRPELSAVLLTPDLENDGRLEGWEIASRALRADQVVLSACASAGGRRVPGEGLVGLVQAFLDAGAGSVVASLWPVVDQGTEQLMGAFYSSLEAKGPGAALADARRQQLDRGGLSAHPYYWSPFVVFGWAPPDPMSASR